MTEPTAKPNARQRISAYLFTALAVVSCPCHLPLLLALLAGTTAGATLSQHWGLAALALTALFVLSVARALRGFDNQS
ncbi:MAG: broad-spectrum mercury transporter MerE [Frateuria sp.]|nr:broad-spectrum mercury transporter MerE [Frateuria sp.]